MTIYEYRALDRKGKNKSGIVDADGPKEARDKLRAQGYSVTELKEVNQKKSKKGKKASGKKVKSEDLALITRQLATLVESDIPLREAMGAMIEQIEDRNLQMVFRDVREKISGGRPFPEALADHPHVFNHLYINMTRAGEASGNIENVLHKIADYLQAQNRMRGKVSAALAYPIVMLVIGMVVVTFLVSFVVPKIQKVILAGKQTLPLPTKILIGFSDFIGNWWLFLLLAAVGGFFGLKWYVSQPRGRRQFDQLLISLPVLGNLFKKQSVSRFAVTFSTLLQSGLPALDSLRIVKNIVDNVLMVETLEQVEKNIIEGGEMATPIRKSKVFPPAVGYMVSIGEKSGNLEEMLTKLALAYDEEVDLATQKFTSLLEPIMIVFMSVIVGFIVLAIILPIMQMNKIN